MSSGPRLDVKHSRLRVALRAFLDKLLRLLTPLRSALAGNPLDCRSRCARFLHAFLQGLLLGDLLVGGVFADVFGDVGGERPEGAEGRVKRGNRPTFRVLRIALDHWRRRWSRGAGRRRWRS